MIIALGITQSLTELPGYLSPCLHYTFGQVDNHHGHNMFVKIKK